MLASHQRRTDNFNPSFPPFPSFCPFFLLFPSVWAALSSPCISLVEACLSRTVFFFFSFNRFPDLYQIIPAAVWVLLQLLAPVAHAPHRSGPVRPCRRQPASTQAPSSGRRGKWQGGFCVIEATADAVQACHREFWNEYGGAGQQAPLRASTRRVERPRPPLGEYQRL